MDPYAQVLDDEFLGRLRRFVRRRAPNEADAEDVVQDALVRLLERGGAVPVASARAWVFTVAQRAAVDRWRGRARTVALDADPVDGVADPATDETARYLARCLPPMLTALTEAERLVLRRVDLIGERQADVARDLRISGSTLRSRVQRARSRLRARLEACCAVERDRRGRPVAHRCRPGRDGPCPPPRDG